MARLVLGVLSALVLIVLGYAMLALVLLLSRLGAD